MIVCSENEGIRITRKELMLGVCKLLAQRATCKRAKVGCVIERDGRILSTGYNGSPPGAPHCLDVGCEMDNGHCVRTIHAEANAIAFAARYGIRIEGATLYVTGWHSGSCPVCTKLAQSAGLKFIYSATGDVDPRVRRVNV
jgi:dCMP deaminase